MTKQYTRGDPRLDDLSHRLMMDAVKMTEEDAGLALQALSLATARLASFQAAESPGAIEHVLMACASMVVGGGLSLRPDSVPSSPPQESLLAGTVPSPEAAEKVSALATHLLEQLRGKVEDNSEGLIFSINAVCVMLGSLIILASKQNGRSSSTPLLLEAIDATIVTALAAGEQVGLEGCQPLRTTVMAVAQARPNEVN